MKKIIKHKGVLFFFLLLIICFAAWSMRSNILSSIGQMLICEDQPEHADAIFILGGSSYDRGNKAAELFHAGISRRLICTGQNVPELLQALSLPAYTEAKITAMNLLRNGVDSSCIEVLETGTSTMEECHAIMTYCMQNQLHTIIILTDRFHTCRVASVFEQTDFTQSVNVLICGAPSSIYSETKWWSSEEGLIMVNNEIVKTLYYLIKY